MRKVLVDTNLTLLLAVGLTNRSYVSRHKRLAAYDIDDYETLYDLVNSFSGLVSCPNIWSETSNLVRCVGDPVRSEIARTLKDLIASSEEVYTESKVAAQREEYQRLGITDAVLLTMARSGGILLTDDLPVYLAAASAGYEAINYNHIREARYESE